MRLLFTDDTTNGKLILSRHEVAWDQCQVEQHEAEKYLTIVWNTGERQWVTIDQVTYEFGAHSLLTLLYHQTVSFERQGSVIVWQFNGEWYGVVDHQGEVSCTGWLSSRTHPFFIQLEKPAQQQLNRLLRGFVQELRSDDHLRSEMLVVLSRRLLSWVAKLASAGDMPTWPQKDTRVRVIKKFYWLVELKFRSEHSVSFYAKELYKSPKTLSNLFALYHHKTPSQVIHDRIMLEARRLLSRTDKPIKEIAHYLGFEEAAHFSNFFKKIARSSPLSFRNKSAGSTTGTCWP